MGKEIVYCGGCGKSLREDDFTRGKAHSTDNRPYCTDCKPLPESHPQTHSSRIAAPAKGSSVRNMPAVHPSTRRRRSDESGTSKGPLLAGIGVIGVGILLLLYFALRSGDRPSDLAPAPPPPPPVVPPKVVRPPVPPPPGDSERAAAALRDLEAFSISSDNPVAILQRCDEVRAVIQGTPLEPKLKAIEERAREARRIRQLESSLEEVAKLRAFDPRCERKEEVLRLLRATLAIAGSRRAEVEEIIRKYEQDAQRLAAQPPIDRPGSAEALGPYETDATGCVNHWLLLGPFGNRANREGIYDQDLLHTELDCVPVAGTEVVTRQSTKVRWTPAVVSEGMIPFRKIDALGLAGQPETPAIAYAACWVVAESDMEVKFRINAETGFIIFLDRQRLRNLPDGAPFSAKEDVFQVKLSQGPHFVLFKVATTGGPFAARLKIAKLGGGRAPGLKIWNQPPAARNILIAESFNEGPGRFLQGEIVDGGIGGTKALVVPQKGIWLENPFAKPITPELTVRFKLKPLFDVRSFEVMMWSRKLNLNAWYHIRNLKKDEWNVVEFKLVDARGGYQMKGPSVEGDMPLNFRLVFDDPVPDGRVLVDDFELFE